MLDSFSFRLFPNYSQHNILRPLASFPGHCVVITATMSIYIHLHDQSPQLKGVHTQLSMHMGIYTITLSILSIHLYVHCPYKNNVHVGKLIALDIYVEDQFQTRTVLKPSDGFKLVWTILKPSGPINIVQTDLKPAHYVCPRHPRPVVDSDSFKTVGQF